MPLAGLPVDSSNINNLKDILLTYNKITEACFRSCAANFNNYKLTDAEEVCVNACSGKHINSNQRMMATFMDIQTRKQQMLFEEMQKQQEQEQQVLQEQQATTGSGPQESEQQLPQQQQTAPASGPQVTETVSAEDT